MTEQLNFNADRFGLDVEFDQVKDTLTTYELRKGGDLVLEIDTEENTVEVDQKVVLDLDHEVISDLVTELELYTHVDSIDWEG